MTKWLVLCDYAKLSIYRPLPFNPVDQFGALHEDLIYEPDAPIASPGF